MPDLRDLSPDQSVNMLAPAANAALERVVAAHLGDTFPALALTVVWGGDVLVNQAWGHIDPASQTLPTQPDTLFDLASVSKVFTTTAFLTLLSARQVELETPLVAVVPEFGASGPRPIDGGMDPESKIQLPTPESVQGKITDPVRVTFRQLLTHTSGLAPWRDVFNASGPIPAPPDQPDSVPQSVRWYNALDALCRYPFVGKPGDGVVRYSDLGMMLLGEAASRLHGAPGRLDSAIHARVLEPLGLESITFNPVKQGRDQALIAPTEDDLDWRGRRCWGEVHDENACGVGGIAGHAGLFGTAHDVAVLGQAWLVRDSRLHITPDVMHAAIQEHAQTDGIRRGLGWLLKSSVDSPAGDRFSPDSYGHTGYTGTSLWIDPQRSLVVAVLTNRVYSGREPSGIHAFRRAIHDLLAQVVDSS